MCKYICQFVHYLSCCILGCVSFVWWTAYRWKTDEDSDWGELHLLEHPYRTHWYNHPSVAGILADALYRCSSGSLWGDVLYYRLRVLRPPVQGQSILRISNVNSTWRHNEVFDTYADQPSWMEIVMVCHRWCRYCIGTTLCHNSRRAKEGVRWEILHL